tara:strand:+ start:1198 stop:1419 length:222 start_codon:yes stop_codon:yes gene_type:complete
MEYVFYFIIGNQHCVGRKFKRETIKNFSEQRKGRIFGKTIPVLINGIEYPTIISAMNATGLSYKKVRECHIPS